MVESLIKRIVLSSSDTQVPSVVEQAPNGQWREVVLSTAETLRAQHLALQKTRHITKRKKKNKKPSEDFTPQPIEVGTLFNTELRTIAAEGLGVSVEALETVVRVVSKKRGFLQEGRSAVTFLGHQFWRQLKKRGIRTSALQKKYRSVLYRHWDPKEVRKGLKEYKRVKKAMRVHPDAALRATCWGMFQVPGFHFKKLGYHNVYDFVKAQQSSEVVQLRDFLRLLAHDELAPHLRDIKWNKFTKRYFGPGYKQMGLMKKLKNRYEKLRQKSEKAI
jgi:hypothetical protein